MMAESMAWPIWAIPRVRPALGKINAHQLSVKRIRRAPRRQDTAACAKNQNPSSHMNMAAGTDMAFHRSPVGTPDFMPRYVGRITLGAIMPRLDRVVAV